MKKLFKMLLITFIIATFFPMANIAIILSANTGNYVNIIPVVLCWFIIILAGYGAQDDKSLRAPYLFEIILLVGIMLINTIDNYSMLSNTYYNSCKFFLDGSILGSVILILGTIYSFCRDMGMFKKSRR